MQAPRVGGKTQPPPPAPVHLPPQPLTAETLKAQLGYPDIYVDVSKRQKQCPNCGNPDHDETTCPAPTMDKLFEAFGAKLYDSTPQAVQEKMKIIQDMLK